MFKIKSNNPDFITTYNISSYDYDGDMTIEVSLGPGTWKDDIEIKVDTLEQRIQTLLDREAKEQALREKHPGLKELYDKYKMVAKLVELGTGPA